MALVGVFANRLLMPDLKAFQDAHPRVELEVETSCAMADLSRREADVAVHCTNSPSEDLVGRRLMHHASAAYASLEYLAEHDPVKAPADCRWIGWADDANQVWVKENAYPDVPVQGIMSDPEVRVAACKAGMGMAKLSCFVADREPDLRRLPPGEPDDRTGIWILTHPDLKNTLRVRTFMQFLARVMSRRRDLTSRSAPRRIPESRGQRRREAIAPTSATLLARPRCPLRSRRSYKEAAGQSGRVATATPSG